MSTYHFTLWLKSDGELTAEIEDKIFEAGCSDATLGVHNSRMYLEFDREAEDALEAVASSMKNVQTAGFIVEGLTSEVEDLVTQSDIARKTSRTRASVSQIVSGQRGPGNFPSPIHIVGSTPAWSWSQVQEWMDRYQGRDVVANYKELSAVISAYQFVKCEPDKTRRDLIVKLLESIGQ